MRDESRYRSRAVFCVLFQSREKTPATSSIWPSSAAAMRWTPPMMPMRSLRVQGVCICEDVRICDRRILLSIVHAKLRRAVDGDRERPAVFRDDLLAVSGDAAVDLVRPVRREF